ncbi:MAG: 8-oxoguanine DNA glycosylase, N-terminal domain-containing protein [Lachnospiraceae bacterium]|nr:8-oxoguanine DNA glycosylase, N-terminal domain-containing protein [Lachnospiraceae bacterium]
MEYNIYEKDNNIILENVPDFSVSQTLECGQCFRFEKISEEKSLTSTKQGY